MKQGAKKGGNNVSVEGLAAPTLKNEYPFRQDPRIKRKMLHKSNLIGRELDDLARMLRL